MRERERSLKSVAVFKVVDFLSGHTHAPDVIPTRPHLRQTTPGQASEASSQPQFRRSSYQVQPLSFPYLPSRTRCLSPPPSKSQELLFPKTFAQDQSPLFMLPEELRLRILEEVVGNRLFHIVRRFRKLGHALCNTGGEFDRCREEQCRGLKIPTGLCPQSGVGNRDLVPLLQTCREIYVRAIQIIYASNIFDFDSMESFIYMSCAILPQRFDSIQSLHLDFRFNLSFYFSESTSQNDWPRWERVWRIVASMESLRRVWIRISWHRELSASEEMAQLEPLRMLTNLETFEVSLPSIKGKEEVKFISDTPFAVTRRFGGT